MLSSALCSHISGTAEQSRKARRKGLTFHVKVSRARDKVGCLANSAGKGGEGREKSRERTLLI